ncbi:hypothetical protein [Nonomuraea longicatena]
MMRKVRLLFATATGAAVLLGGAGLTATSASAAQVALAGDISGVSVSGAYIPNASSTQASFDFTLRDPLGTAGNEAQASVSAEITPATGGSRGVSLSYSPPSKGTDGSLPTSASGSGTFTINREDPSGDWTLTFRVTRGGSTSTDTFNVKVTGKQGITGASVNPDPVRLKKGKDVRVDVRATVKDATNVSATLVSDETTESYDLGTLSDEYDGTWSGHTFFSDDTTPGDWTLVVTANRGGEALRGELDFTVSAPEGGASKKTKTRVTLTVPKKVKAGKTAKVYGKVYRGSKAYKKKVVEVYFKSEDAKKYRLLGLAKSDAAGKYAKTFTGKKDGYFKVKVPGTSKTRTSWSPQKHVDVK